VPVHTFNDWKDPVPGFCEVDMVAHGGTSVAGSLFVAASADPQLGANGVQSILTFTAMWSATRPSQIGHCSRNFP
jgi:hypothetical protein